MDLKIQNKKALITGAGRGIGKSIAIHLAKEDVNVAIISRSKSDLNDTLKEMKTGNHYTIVSDLTQENAISKIINELNENFGEINILVNNLGGDLNIKDPYCTISDWRSIFKINLEIGIELNNILIPYMRKQKWGRIVNISSIASLENQGSVSYCTVKAALTAYTRSMGRILSTDGIIMTAVLPGAVFTENGYWDVTSKINPEHVKKYLSERMSIKRFGLPDEIASIVTFMCSESASFCVGTSILVDGGQGRCFQL